MTRIAVLMLFGDRSKLVAIVIGIMCAALIMTQQPSTFIGLLTRTYAFIDDVGIPDVWVMDSGVEYVEEHKPLRDTALNRVRGIDDVAWAVPMYKAMINVRLPDGRTKTVSLTGLDDSTLIGGPPEVLEGNLGDLRRADGIMLDEEAATVRLRYMTPEGVETPLRVGDEVEINDRRAVIVAIGRSSRDFVLVPKVFTTYSRALRYAPQQARQLTYVLVKAREAVDPAQLAQRISEQTGLRALTREQFRQMTFGYWMRNTGIPINFGVSTLLGFLVGAAIAGQSFYNFVQTNLHQYAALKAMGLRNSVLVRMVLVQASIVGGIGYGLGVGISALFGTHMRGSVLSFLMLPQVLLFAACGVIAIVLTAAVLGIRQVLRLDPAVVFRS